MSDIRPQSFFGANLVTLFFIGLACTFFATNAPDGIDSLVTITAFIMNVLFVFGLLYGFFRMFGVRDQSLEHFYQHFPLRLSHGAAERDEQLGRTGKAQPWEPDYEASAAAWDEEIDFKSEFSWDDIFSFKYLRFVGLLLILTGLFALLFNVEWALIHKVWFCWTVGILGMIAAEILHRRKKLELCISASLIGYALLQFALSLTAKYATEVSVMLPNIPTGYWVGGKMLLTALYLMPIHRYRSALHTPLFAVITYLAPLSLHRLGIIYSPQAATLFLVASSIIILEQTLNEKRYGVFALNAGLSFFYTFLFFLIPTSTLRIPMSITWWGLFTASALFVIHFLISLYATIKQPKCCTSMQSIHVISLHVLMVLAIMASGQMIEFVDHFMGLIFLFLSCASFWGYLLLLSKRVRTNYTDNVLNLAIIISAMGIFLQVHGPWSSIVFLIYSSVILWLSIVYAHPRTRIYGFVILSISVAKLYLEFSDVFDSIPGSIAVVAIGVILTALSYKYEAIKDLVLDALPHTKEHKDTN